MNNSIRKTLTFIFIFFISTCVNINAKDLTMQQSIKLKVEENAPNMDMVIKDNFIKAKYTSAENRFLQGNVKASHDDFNDLISKVSHDDYVFLAYSLKMSEYGFFDLTTRLFNILDNNLYTQNYKNDVKNFYYPSGLVKDSEMIYLADAYASINYNNLAMETTSELLNNKQIGDSDYKDYVIALGYYKSNNLTQALTYINKAIDKNDINVNYKILRARILADSNKISLAKKAIKEIQKTKFVTYDFQQKIKAIEEYVEYKTAKDESLKDLHLAYYYYLQDNASLATKVLQAVIMQSKQYAPQSYALLSKIYYENGDSLKAQEFAERALRGVPSLYEALITLAEINYDERSYDNAIKYYKKAKKYTDEQIPNIGLAKSYYALKKTKKAEKMYEKMLKKHPLNEDLIIASLKAFPQRADDYLPRIASIDISNNDIWINLAKWAIKESNYNMAETYLNNAYYIDENNFKYYYYLSLILKAKGDIDKSNMSLINCVRLNSDYATSVGRE